ncbi:hypothetical protein H7F51_16785 [Novosphingobium flavum]|uniref:DUF5801 domain-containing protein n=1 Tax=Novosphingobium flavum TaxID=1778672 RepID=A0A7X1FUE5_9SPHN|nr:DUF5801 repeats-in-toxin domain-containing protein [Novosphingobium flavum]MBC2667178.1 hypothetical protein [Novosphingobium flavum]
MSISITVAPSLVLDETAGIQNSADSTAPLTDNDVALSYDPATNQLTSAVLDSEFLTFLMGLNAADSAEDAALGFAASVGGASSSDTFITVSATDGETIDDLFFSATGNGMITSVTSLDDEVLYFHVAANNSFATLTTSATDGAGRIVAAFYLDEADNHLSGQVQMVTFEALKHPDAANPDDPINFSDVLKIGATGSLSFDFDNLASGNFLWVAIGTESAGLLVTGADLNVNDDSGSNKYGEHIPGGSTDPSDTMNTSQGGAGATIGVNSQHFVAGGQGQNVTDGSTAVFTLVRGFVPLPTRGEATATNQQATGTNVQQINYGSASGDYINTTGAGLFVSQLTGTHADMRVSLWEAGGGTTVEESFAYIGNQDTDSALHDDAAIKIGSVSVVRGNTTYTFNASGNQSGIAVTFVDDAFDNSFTITGLHALDTVKWTTLGGDTFNRFQVQALSTTNAFDVGRIDILQGFDTTTGLGSHLFVDDDGPSIVNNGSSVPLLTTDDSLVPQTTSAVSFAGLFTPAFGKDGFLDNNNDHLEDADALTYALSLKNGQGTVSGLTDTLSGDAIWLRVTAGGDVEGYVSTNSSTVAFLIDLNTTTGTIALTQYRSVVHDDPADPVESGTAAASMAADLVVLTATIRDGDGDSDTDPANIGNAFRFEDAGPTISRNLTAVPSLTTDDSDITDSAGPTSFAGLFTGNFGQDGFKDSNDNDVEDPDAISYALGVSATGGVLSGLFDTLSGDRIYLYLESGVVVGRVGLDDNLGPNAAGAVALRISVNSDSGDVTLQQVRSVVHDNPGDPAETGSSAAGFASAGLVTLTATIRDGDGDSQSAPADIGDAFHFEDDGPTISRNANPLPALVTDDTDITDSAGPTSFASLFNTDFGDDGYKDSDDNDVEDLDAVSFAMSLKNGNGTNSTLVDTLSGDDILLRLTGGGDIEGYLENATSTVAFLIDLDANSGNVTLTQYRAIYHSDPLDSIETGTAAEKMPPDLIVLTATIRDGDGDSQSAPTNIGDAFHFEDDGPSVTGASVETTVDDDGGAGGNAGGVGDINAPRVVSGTVTALFDGGSDGLKSFTMSLANFGGTPPVTYSQGDLLAYDQTGDLLTGYVEDGTNTGYQQGEDRDVFTFELNVGGVAGAFDFTLIDQIDHAIANTEDEFNLEIGILLQAIDNDDDKSSAAAPIQLTIVVDDDSPEVTTANDTSNDAAGSNDTITTTGATGNFVYAIGFDDRVGTTYSATNSDFSAALASGLIFNGTIGGAPITVGTTSWVSETDTEARFSFTFSYVSDPSSNTPTANGGTLLFDKDDGTYTFTLTDPISSFGILSLANAQGFAGYLPNTSTPDSSQPEVTVAALADDFFVQFTGAHETGGGTDGNNASQQNSIGNNKNLDALAPGEAWSNGDDDNFANGELFTQAPTWVSVSGTAAGTAGDTMQAGEVLDFNFYAANPQGFLNSGVAKATTGTMFIEFDALDNGEDLVVVLKLVDRDDASITTTRAVIVQYQDIFHIAEANQIPPSYVDPKTIDQNDGLIVIESNDYNVLQNDNWTISGAQVVASTEGLTGTGIDLNRALGDTGGSAINGTDPFNTVKDSGGNNGGTWDGDVFKIVNIGFLTEITPDSQFVFNVKVIDYDGDASANQSLTIDVTGDTSQNGLAPLTASFTASDAELLLANASLIPA